jgi:hypothetical protein
MAFKCTACYSFEKKKKAKKYSLQVDYKVAIYIIIVSLKISETFEASFRRRPFPPTREASTRATTVDLNGQSWAEAAEWCKTRRRSQLHLKWFS